MKFTWKFEKMQIYFLLKFADYAILAQLANISYGEGVSLKPDSLF